MDPKVRALLIGVRRGLLIILGALEEYLDLPRSRPPKSAG